MLWIKSIWEIKFTVCNCLQKCVSLDMCIVTSKKDALAGDRQCLHTVSIELYVLSTIYYTVCLIKFRLTQYYFRKLYYCLKFLFISATALTSFTKFMHQMIHRDHNNNNIKKLPYDFTNLATSFKFTNIWTWRKLHYCNQFTNSVDCTEYDCGEHITSILPLYECIWSVSFYFF